MTPSQPPAADIQPVAPGRAAPAVSKYETKRQALLNESPELRYARETRNATVFIAVMAGVVAVIVLIGVIIAVVQLASLAHDLSGVSALG